MRMASRSVLILCLLAAFNGCNRLLATPISTLRQNPREYEGKSLTISGKVTARNSLLLLKFFTVNDGTGEINVITKRAMPEVGSKVRVHGRVQEAFSLGQEQSLVFVEDDAGK